MDDIELIKQKINLVELISEYVPLKKAGVNFKSPCPFHSEKTPSFVVSPERGIWHCFGCQKGGDCFKFVMEKEGVEFGEALEILAKRAGVVLERKKRTSQSLQKDRLFEINAKSLEFFHHLLLNHPLGKKALAYLLKRGLTEDSIKKFQLGYSPNSWDSLVKFLGKRGFTLPEMVDSGLVVPSQRGGYDRFRGRIVFPLINVRGEVMGFSGRILGVGEPKYLNTPQTQIFDKGSYLFGLHLSKGDIKQKKMAIITEGEMDMLMSYQSGIKFVVASKGTALTEHQIELIKKYTDTILLCFDKDLAGDAASRRGIEMAEKAGLIIKVVQVPDGKDPAETCLHNPDLWSKAVEEAVSIYDYYLDSMSKRFNLKTAEGKRKAGAELIPIWKMIADPLTFEHYLQRLSALLSIDDSILRREIRKPTAAITPSYQDILHSPSVPVALRSRQELLEEYLLALLLKIPPTLDFVPNFPETIFMSEDLKSIYVLLVIYLDSISFQSKAFKIANFSDTLPPEFVVSVDRLYLTEINDKLIGPKEWKTEVDTVVAAIKKALIKSSLEKLSTQIKNAQEFGKIEQLELLNRRFRDLSLKLKNM